MVFFVDYFNDEWYVEIRKRKELKEGGNKKVLEHRTCNQANKILMCTKPLNLTIITVIIK